MKKYAVNWFDECSGFTETIIITEEQKKLLDHLKELDLFCILEESNILVQISENTDVVVVDLT